MTPESLVPSRETCIALKEAGWDVPTCFYWEQWEDDGLDPAGPTPEPEFYVCPADVSLEEAQIAPAPTLGEILEQLPESKLFEPEGERQVRAGYLTLDKCAKYEIGFFSGTTRFPLAFEAHGNPAEAAARLWIKVKEGR